MNSSHNLFSSIIKAVLDTDPTLFRHFKGHRGTVTALAFSPNMGHLGISILFVNNISKSFKTELSYV